MLKIFKKGFVLLSCISLLSCSSTTMIRITDPKAKIYIDGEFKGKGSASYSDSKIVGSKTHVTIQRDGCEPQAYILSRDEEFAIGPFIGGLFLLIPWLWVMEYRSQHIYEYECTHN